MIGDRRRMDTRAVVPAIGFVLLIAIAVSWLGLYQAEIVPVQNLQTEYEHNEDIQNELVELRDLIHRSGTTGISSSMPIELGTQYDSRLFAVNPHRPTGRISTTEPPSNITIRIGDSEADFETKFIEYEPNYREYENAPSTTIEHSLVYNSFPNAEKSVTISGHRLFEGNQLTIPIISGDISEQGANAVSVRITALDRPEEGEGDIQFTPGDTVNVTLPTEQPELWQDELEYPVERFRN